ncbi:MAG: PadR family transcriptional regulator [Deltaproteobacteria bacterium]|nr:PadR family transcriptional regulator [Deltaproteobacteria bacterium]
MSIKYAILGLLNYSDMHGYQIKTHIERNFGHMWSINFGQVYPSLKNLKKEGLINMVEVALSENGGPRKKLYSITEKGVDEFSRWLAEFPQKPILIRDLFLLKFAFFGFGDDERTLEIIDRQTEIYEAQLEQRQVNRNRWERQSVYVRLMIDLGITQIEMYLEWLRHARSEIQKQLTGSSSVENTEFL